MATASGVDGHPQGLRLVLVSLLLAVISTVFSASLPFVVAAAPADTTSYVMHTIIVAGVNLALLVAVASLGSAGILILERERWRASVEPRRLWDRARIALLVAVLGTASLLLSGLVIGLIYLPIEGFAAGRLAAQLLAAVGIGLYLLWTVERIDPGLARRLGRIALVSGMTSVAISVGTTALFTLHLEGSLSTLDWYIVFLIGFALGLLSLIAWIVIFSRLALTPRNRGPIRVPIES